MQSNTPYITSLDQTSRIPISMSQPVLTRSLPSVAVSVPTTLDNVMVSGIYQSYVPSLTNIMGNQSRAQVAVIGGIGDGTVPQKQAQIQNCFQNPLPYQKSSPPLMSTARPISVQQPQNYSTNIQTAKILDKSKKKNKSRMKIKYLLKIIKIEENPNPSETILSFEMVSMKNQMRFTCCLNKGINSLDVLNSVGDYGQFPVEIVKNEIIESLINTVKKMCEQLTEDINSIPLNEDYVFHPCLPNSDLIKLSDALSSDHDPSCHVNSLQSLQPSINFPGSSASSRSLSRHPSNEDLSEQLTTHFAADFDHNKSFPVPSLDGQKKFAKSLLETDCNLQTIVSTKCTCPINDSTLKVPDYIFPYVRQIIDKLLNHNCKGLIILPQTNDILTRNIRILEIPPDHMFVGLPYSDNTYNVIKGHKDKDFIIAKDNRDPENVIEKCVYQKPVDGAVLLDSSGEVTHIVNPSLIIPPKPGFGFEKTAVRELPSELTHRKDQWLDCDQIVSVLQSLTHCHSTATSDQSKDELFDSPVMLEPVKNLLPKSHSNPVDRSELVDHFVRRGSDEASIGHGQSQIQVERIFCEYVPLTKSNEVRHDEGDRDLPKQQVRIRKISSESIDSGAAFRTRATSTVTCVTEAELQQAHPGSQKMMGNTQIGFPNLQRPLSTSTMTFVNDSEQGSLQKIIGVQKTVPVTYNLDTELISGQSGGHPKMINLQNPSPYQMGPLLNQMPLQRMANVAGQYVLTNQNPSSSIPTNIYIQNVPTVPLFANPTPGAGPSVVMSQNSANMPTVVLTNQVAPVLNFPTQVVIPAGRTPGQRLAAPSSSQLMSNIAQNMIPVTQQLLSNQVYPVQIPQPQFSEQHPDIVDQSFASLSRQNPIRQLPTPGSSQYFDQNMINSIVAENIRIQLKNQSSSAGIAQAQQTASSVIVTPVPVGPQVLVIPHPPLPASGSAMQPPQIMSAPGSLRPELTPSSLDSQHASVILTEVDSKPKSEQIVGRFIIRPVTESAENS